jgi:hypothetical protein
VFVYKLITAGSVEEKIVAMQQQKAALADAILSDDAVRRCARTGPIAGSISTMLWWAQRLGVDGLAWSTAELQSPARAVTVRPRCSIEQSCPTRAMRLRALHALLAIGLRCPALSARRPWFCTIEGHDAPPPLGRFEPS